MFTVKVKRHTTMDVGKIAALLQGPTKVKVGFPAGKTDIDIVQRAVWNEFGTRGGASGGGWGGPIPERPFLRNAVRANQYGIRSVLGKQAAQILRGETALGASLSKLGIYFQGKIQGEITSLASPPNSPVTIKLKGSSNPLIDTGEMRQRVTWKVDDGA